MGVVRKYHVTHNGHRTIMRLNDQDVKAYPDAQLVEDPEPTATPEPSPEPSPEPATKSRTAANKARRPAGDKTSSN